MPQTERVPRVSILLAARPKAPRARYCRICEDELPPMRREDFHAKCEAAQRRRHREIQPRGLKLTTEEKRPRRRGFVPNYGE